MTDNAANVSGLTDDNLADVTAQLDALDLTGESDESLLEQIEETLEASAQPDDVIEDVVQEDAVTETFSPAVDEAVTNALDDLDLGDISQEELDEIERRAEREAIYAAQSSDVDTSMETPAAAAKAPKERKARAPKAAKPAGTPRASKDVSTLDATMFVFDSAVSIADLEQNKADVLAAKPVQVKVAEKFDNLLTSLAVDKAPSVYVVAAFEALDKNKVVTSSGLAATYKALGHKDGTANSQSGQMMALFDAVKIASRARNTLTLNPNSTLAVRLRDVLAKVKGA